MKLFVSTIILVFSFFNTLSAQSAGLVIQAGLSAGYAKDGNITKANQAHYGWTIGADARLLEGDLYFILGAQYHSTSLNSTSEPGFFNKKDWKIFMTRAGLGFNLIKFSETFFLRSKLLGSINFIMDAPLEGLNKPGYMEVNDSFFGATTGLGITMGNIDLDLDFQYGFINAYFEQPKSTFDFWTLMAEFISK